MVTSEHVKQLFLAWQRIFCFLKTWSALWHAVHKTCPHALFYVTELVRDNIYARRFHEHWYEALSLVMRAIDRVSSGIASTPSDFETRCTGPSVPIQLLFTQAMGFLFVPVVTVPRARVAQQADTDEDMPALDDDAVMMKRD